VKELGVDTVPFERFFAALIHRVGQLEPPQQQPEGFFGFLQSIGLLDPSPTNEAELQTWRDGIRAKTEAYWLRLLESEDPDTIKHGLQGWMHAVAQFDDAQRLSAEASLQAIVAWQKLVEELAGVVPVIGNALDLLAAARGETLSGEEKSAFSRLILVAGVLGPAVLEKIVKRMGRAGPEALEELGELGEQIATKEGRQEVARLAGTTEQQVEKAAENLSHLPPTAKGVAVENRLAEHVRFKPSKRISR
jgi:hypothetical protein